MARLIVPRTVTVVDGESGVAPPRWRSSGLLAPMCLLGDPGAGKTEAFRAEGAGHDDGEFITARRFLWKGVDRLSDWVGKTLFIDGLDEVRAGSSDPRRQLDQVLERLERLGRPTFRLSCRAADWLGRNDLREIASDAGYEELAVLQLEPLSGNNIAHIVADLGFPDARAFVAEAGDRGLGEMLGNPHSLGLLVKLALGGEWPKDRRGTMVLACRKLARESNDEHRAAHRNVPSMSTGRIISAAGHLSALSLLSGRALVSLDSSDDSEYLHSEDIPDGDQPALMRAVKSNLFESHPDGGFASPHRQLSEFLAAGFLHDRIDAGVPVRRVMALMTGDDGIVVTELRGLSAWLAAFNRASRLALVESDPVGVALYGDVSSFRRDEMEHLLHAFAERDDGIRPRNWPTVALTSLINEHSVAVLTRYLNEDDRVEGRQSAVGLLMHALSHATGARPCLKSLERAIRDATWNPVVRKSALRALLYHSGDEASSTLIRLVDDLRDGRVEDRDGDLMGTLLSHLYPVHLGPGRIGDYLVPLGSPDYIGAYRLFWSTHLPRIGPRSRVWSPFSGPSASKGKRSARKLGCTGCRVLLEKLVRKALDAEGDTLTASIVYDWLELIDFEVPESALARTDEYLAVTKWLADRPELQKELALEGLNRRVGAGYFAPGSDHEGADDQDGHGHARAPAVYRATQIKWTVFRAGKPDDFPAWSLSQAVATAETNPMMARILLEWSLPWDHDDSGSGLSIHEVRAATRDVPSLRDEVANLPEGQRTREADEAERRVREEQHNEYLQERQRKKEEFITYVRKHAVELQEGRCPPGLLHRIAVAYHDFFHDQRAATPQQRVLKLLHGHQDLAVAAMQGFRRVVDRDDLPTLREVIRLNEQKLRSHYALPILAALDANPGLLESRSPAEIGRAAALYYLTPLNVPGHPAWYRWALEHRPEPISEALLKVTRSRVRRRLDCNYLWDFGRNGSYRYVAHLAAVPLLRAFPTRCTEPQISALHAVLLAALRWQVDGLGAFLEGRVSKPGLDVSQQALWLTAGLHLSPERYVERIAAFLEDGEEARSRQVVRLLAPMEMAPLPMQWDTRELATMIKLMGSRYSPWWPEGSGMASVVDEDRSKVKGLISAWATTLASRTSRQASETLHSLARRSRPRAVALHAQGQAGRAGTGTAGRHLRSAGSAIRFRQTLSNKRARQSGRPDRPGGKQAGVRLGYGRSVAAPLTTGGNTGVRTSGVGVRRDPSREESCRDALLCDSAKGLLPSGDGCPAGIGALSGQAVGHPGLPSTAMRFPVEIKKDSNRQLWSAVADQLIAEVHNRPRVIRLRDLPRALVRAGQDAGAAHRSASEDPRGAVHASRGAAHRPLPPQDQRDCDRRERHGRTGRWPNELMEANRGNP